MYVQLYKPYLEIKKLRTTGSTNNLIRYEAHKSCSRKYYFCASFAMMWKTKKKKKAPNHLKYFFAWKTRIPGLRTAAFCGSPFLVRNASWKIDDGRRALLWFFFLCWWTEIICLIITAFLNISWELYWNLWHNVPF